MLFGNPKSIEGKNVWQLYVCAPAEKRYQISVISAY